jgi:hypothetical protein
MTHIYLLEFLGESKGVDSTFHTAVHSTLHLAAVAAFARVALIEPLEILPWQYDRVFISITRYSVDGKGEEERFLPALHMEVNTENYLTVYIGEDNFLTPASVETFVDAFNVAKERVDALNKRARGQVGHVIGEEYHLTLPEAKEIARLNGYAISVRIPIGGGKYSLRFGSFEPESELFRKIMEE